MSDPETPTNESPNGSANRKRERNRSGRPNRAGVDFSAPKHQARILAMQALFEFDQTDHDIDDVLARIDQPAPSLDAVTGEPGEEPSGEEEIEESDTEFVPPQVARRAIRLTRGVLEHLAEIDPHIEKAAPAFPIDQLAAIDRCVLRLAVYELVVTKDDVPFKVAINEAVEIAKRYGGDRSGSFVNGVLGTIAKSVRSQG
jgi:N utilization substance protein B